MEERQGLTDDERLVLRLKDEGQTYRQIADALGFPSNTYSRERVRQILAYARRKARNAIDERCRAMPGLVAYQVSDERGGWRDLWRREGGPR